MPSRKLSGLYGFRVAYPHPRGVSGVVALPAGRWLDFKKVAAPKTGVG